MSKIQQAVETADTVEDILHLMDLIPADQVYVSPLGALPTDDAEYQAAGASLKIEWEEYGPEGPEYLGCAWVRNPLPEKSDAKAADIIRAAYTNRKYLESLEALPVEELEEIPF